MAIATQDALDALFHPRAVAVIGASDDSTKHGYIVLNNIRDTGFRGGVYGISRRLSRGQRHPVLPRSGRGAGTGRRRLPGHPRRGRGPGGARLRAGRTEGGDRRLGRLCRKPRCRRRRSASANCSASPQRGGHPHRRPQLQRHLQRAPSGFDRLQHLPREAADARRRSRSFPTAARCSTPWPGRLAMARRRPVAVRLGRQRGRPVGARLHGIRASRHAPTRVIALLIDSLEDGPRFRRAGVDRRACRRQARGRAEDRRLRGRRGRRGRAFVPAGRRRRGLSRAVRRQRRRHGDDAGRPDDRRARCSTATAAAPELWARCPPPAPARR